MANTTTTTTLYKRLPNALSFARIPLSLSLLFVKPFSAWFMGLYLACGLTDALDGFFARKLNAESSLGANLDSIADFTFFAVGLYVFLTAVPIPPEVVTWALAIVLLRVTALLAASLKFRSWPALHTNLFKITGFAFFFFPILYGIFGAAVAAAIVCTTGSLAAGEEIYINLCSESLDPDIRNARELKSPQAPR